MRFFDPVPLAPFLAWAQQRQAQIGRELDAYPALGETNRLGSHTGGGGCALERLCADLGWPGESGKRKLHRWRCENLSGTAERLGIETALHHAGVDFEAIYPDLPAARKQRGAGRCKQCGNPLLRRAPLCGFCLGEQREADEARMATAA